MIDGHSIDQTDSFKYLVIYFSANSNWRKNLLGLRLPPALAIIYFSINSLTYVALIVPEALHLLFGAQVWSTSKIVRTGTTVSTFFYSFFFFFAKLHFSYSTEIYINSVLSTTKIDEVL